MKGRTILALVLVFSVVFVLPFGVDAQKLQFPEGEYKYKPKPVPPRSPLPRPSNDSGLKSIQGSSYDLESMRNFATDSKMYNLGKKVAHLYMNGSVCSGFLVGPDLLMTNHHCVFNKHSGRARRIQDFKVYMDYYVDNWKGGISAGVKQILRSSKELDYALLRLDKPIGNTYG